MNIFTLLLVVAVLTTALSFNMGASRLGRSTRLAVGSRTGRGALAMLNEPHGGKGLVNTMVTGDAKDAAIKSCEFSMELDERQLCDVELLMNGGLSPLDGFMSEADYTGVVNDMTTADGTMFGLPIVFDTDDERMQPGKKVLLEYKGTPIATFDVSSRYTPDKPLEAKNCYGTSSLEHPGTAMIAMERQGSYCGGKITGLNVPVRDFPCQSPAEVRAMLPDDKQIVAFQCRNPIHRAHYELFTRALDDSSLDEGAVVLVHPTCGPTQPGDIPGDVRYKTYEVLKKETENPRVFWAYLPYSMHMAGPREAIQHMIIRKNFGCTHFIIGRDMAGCKSSIDGEDFYGPYDAQDFAKENGPKIGMTPVPSLNLVYTEEEDYTTADYAKDKGLTLKSLSGTKFRKMLRAGDDIPNWFAFESVVKVLREEAQAATD